MVDDAQPQWEALRTFLAEMAGKYFAAQALSRLETPERIAARVMSVGTYRGVCELVDLAGRPYLACVLAS